MTTKKDRPPLKGQAKEAHPEVEEEPVTEDIENDEIVFWDVDI